MNNPAVSVIIVSYECADLLRRTLVSVERQVVPGGFEIIVVDNASRDGSADVARAFERVDAVALGYNVGFGAANNIGARRAVADRLLFLNPDVVLEEGVIAGLAKFLAARPPAGAVGPAIVNADGSLQKFCARRYPGFLQLLLQVSGLGESRWAEGKRLHRFYPDTFYKGPPAQAEALAGACMMVRRAAFEALGGFDEGYFLYSEDVDLCRRIRDHGWEIWYVPGGKVEHFTGGSRRTPNPLVVAESHRSAARYARRWHGAAASLLVRFCSGASLRIRRLLFGIAGVINAASRERGRLYAQALRLKKNPGREG